MEEKETEVRAGEGGDRSKWKRRRLKLGQEKEEIEEKWKRRRLKLGQEKEETEVKWKRRRLK